MRSHDGFITPQVVDTVLSIPATAHVGVLQTGVVLVGQLGRWFNKRRPQPYLGNYLPRSMGQIIKPVFVCVDQEMRP